MIRPDQLAMGPELIAFVLDDLECTQKELAAAVGSSQGHISKLSSGARRMGRQFATRLLAAHAEIQERKTRP